MNYLKWKDHRQQVRDRRDEIRAQLEMIDLRIRERYPEVQRVDSTSLEGKSIAIKAIGLALFVAIIVVLTGITLHTLWPLSKEAPKPQPFVYSGPSSLSTSGGTITQSFSDLTEGTSSKSTRVGPSAAFTTITGGYEMTQPILVGSGSLPYCVTSTSSGVVTNAGVCDGGSSITNNNRCFTYAGGVLTEVGPCPDDK